MFFFFNFLGAIFLRARLAKITNAATFSAYTFLPFSQMKSFLALSSYFPPIALLYTWTYPISPFFFLFSITRLVPSPEHYWNSWLQYLYEYLSFGNYREKKGGRDILVFYWLYIFPIRCQYRCVCSPYKKPRSRIFRYHLCRKYRKFWAASEWRNSSEIVNCNFGAKMNFFDGSVVGIHS